MRFVPTQASKNIASQSIPTTVHRSHSRQSLAQTRLHFLSQLAGFTKEDEKAKVDWKTDISPHNPNALPTSFFTGEIPLGGEGRRKSSAAGKGKERASLGGGGRASPGRTSLGGEGGGVGSSGRKKRRSAGVGS
jgi:hypothetical protein